jgi:hypothetical protein
MRSQFKTSERKENWLLVRCEKEAVINKPEGTYSSIPDNRGENLPHALWIASKPEGVGM